jgi:hypothetical protein
MYLAVVSIAATERINRRRISPEDREADVDEEVSTASCDYVSSQGWDCRGFGQRYSCKGFL